jgi:glucosamine-phosphate N-acetyltransferase
MKFIIRDLHGPDLAKGLLDTLSNLADVELTPEFAGECHRRRLRSGIRSFVALALETEAVIGTASLFVEQKFIHGGGIVGHIEDVAVCRGYERMGVGAALVRHATEEAQNIGCYKVILNCSEKLIPYYEALDFRCQGVEMRIDLKPSDIADERKDHLHQSELYADSGHCNVRKSRCNAAAQSPRVLSSQDFHAKEPAAPSSSLS